MAIASYKYKDNTGPVWLCVLHVVVVVHVCVGILVFILKSNVMRGGTGRIVGDRFVLGTTPSHVSIPPNLNALMTKAGLSRWENVL